MSLKVYIPFNKAKDSNFNFSNNILDYSTWRIGTSGSQTGFDQNGTTDENKIMVRDNPIGEQDIVWATESNNTDSNSDGGFNSSTYTIDKTKSYRISCWMRRENVVEALGGGSTYFGVRGYTGESHTGLENSNGTTNKNPYFISHSIEGYGVMNDEWYLYIGYVYPSTHNYTSDTKYDGGVWKTDGTKVTNTSAYLKFLSTTDKLMMRAYLFYSTKIDERMYWYRPRIDRITGSEPSIEDLLNLREANTLPILKDELDNVSIKDNGVTFKTGGKIGKYYAFTDTTKSVTLYKKNKSINFSNMFENNFTVSAWINISNMSSGDNAIFDYGSSTTNKKLHLVIRNSKPYLGFHGNDYSTTHTVSQDKWTHIVYVGDKTNMIQRVYVDGVEIGSGRSVTSWLNFGGSEFTPTIGNRSSLYPLGGINDFRIYDHALSSNEVSELAKGLLLHYSFDNTKNVKNIINYQYVQGVDSSTFGIRTYGISELDKTIDGTSLGIVYEINPDILLKPKTKYCMSCKAIYEKGSSNDNLLLNSRFYDENGLKKSPKTEGGVLSINPTSGKHYQKRYITFETSEKSPFQKIGNFTYSWHLWHSSNASSKIEYFTDLQIEESKIPTLYENPTGNRAGIENDKTENGNHFIKNISTSFKDKAVEFTGKEFIRSSKPIQGNSLSFNFWFKTSVGNSSKNPMIVLNQGNNYSQSEQNQVWIGVINGKLAVHLWEGLDIQDSGALINDNKWHMATVSIDTSTTDSSKRIAKVYIDKNIVLEKNYSEGNNFSLYSENYMWIGYDHNKRNTWNEFLEKTSISDIRVFSNIITQTEINNLYTGGRQ